jgi:hypothetical protein
MKTKFIPATFILLASSALTLPAFAEDVPPVVSALFKNWEDVKITPTYDKLETDSDGNVTITNLSATMPAKDAGPEIKVSVAEITLNDVGDEENGIIEVGSMKATNTKAEFSAGEGKSVVVEMPEATAEGVHLHVAVENPTPLQAFLASYNMADKASSGAIKITAMGQTITSDGYDVTWDGDAATGNGKVDFTVKNIAIPEAAIAAMDTSGQIKQLGYGDLSFDVAGGAEIKVTDDKFGFTSNISYSGKDIGAFKLALDANGVPMSAVAEFQKAQKEQRPPDMAALMPQLMNVTFGNLQVRFEDASITKKLLPVIAKMQGMDETTMVANAGAMMQLGLMQLKNQAFTDQVVGAVNAFLKDPKSITVSMKPAQPIAVQSLMMLNPADPGAAITTLGLSVTSND